MEQITELERLLRKTPERLIKKASAAQKDIYSELLREIALLDMNATGIKPSAKNLVKLTQIKRKTLGIILDDEYTQGVKSYFQDWDKAEKLLNDYFGETFANFSVPDIIPELRKQTISITQNSLLEAGIEANVVEPINKVLLQSVTGNATFKDTTNAIREIILGDPERLGRLERYVSQISTDAANQYTANYIDVVSNDLGLEWYLYRGGEQTTTRPFCKDKVGRYFNKKTVQGWASGSWAGRIPNTNSSNIFIYRGGYNCRHILIPVSESVVPKQFRTT
jgi:hypothetical protein